MLSSEPSSASTTHHSKVPPPLDAHTTEKQKETRVRIRSAARSSRQRTPLLLSIRRGDELQERESESAQDNEGDTSFTESSLDAFTTAGGVGAGRPQGSNGPSRSGSLSSEEPSTDNYAHEHLCMGEAAGKALKVNQDPGATLLSIGPSSVASPLVETESPLMSTPKSGSMRSFRLSDEDLSADEATSQVFCEDTEEDNAAADSPSQISAGTSSQPQLVMPSIRMPIRRPFTERGRNLGKLKIMVVGRKDTGKTSLIRSIVSRCEDIVHIDPIETQSACSNSLDSRNIALDASDTSRNSNMRSDTIEIHASSRPYPSWWAEDKASKILKRRKSFNDTVLERNITMVDTTGLKSANSAYDLEPLTTYLQTSARRNIDLGSMSDSDLLSVLSGTGGCEVDLILYLISHRETSVPEAVELETIRALSDYTNVVPVLSKVDLYSITHLMETQKSWSEALQAANIQCFRFAGFGTREDSDHGTGSNIDVPAVSVVPLKDDYDSMDASVLMAPNYVPPIEASQLSKLIETVFDPNVAACLRHRAARSSIRRHRQHLQNARSMSFNTIRPDLRSIKDISRAPTKSFAALDAQPDHTHMRRSRDVVPTTHDLQGSSPLSATSWADVSDQLPPAAPDLANDYALARITDHTQREERLAQVHLARWAADLQRTLRNERVEYANLHDQERTHWLLERLKERTSPDGDNSDTRKLNSSSGRSRSASRLHIQATEHEHRDPLGLLAWQDVLTEKGVLLARVIGSVGITGAVMIWAMRIWGRGGGLSLHDLLTRPVGQWSFWGSE